MGFSSFILRRDLLGHPVSINYKGESSYNTYFGSFLSIVIYALVLVQLVQRIIDLINMSDPNITIIERPVYEEESVNFGQLNL